MASSHLAGNPGRAGSQRTGGEAVGVLDPLPGLVHRLREVAVVGFPGLPVKGYSGGLAVRIYLGRDDVGVGLGDHDPDEIFELAVDAGADDVVFDSEEIEIFGEANAFKLIGDQLRAASIKTDEAALRMIPNQEMELPVDQTIAVLTGFITGSLGILWPWKEPITEQFGEKIKTIGFDYYTPQMNSEFYFAIFFIILGIVSIAATEFIANKIHTCTSTTATATFSGCSV